VANLVVEILLLITVNKHMTIFLQTRIAIGAAVVGTLAGCTAYVESPPPPPMVTYEAPPPPSEPAPVYAASADGVVIVAESDFYQPLAVYGEWVEVDGYGRCWRPHNVDGGWRPYTSGRWQRTDTGWYWVSAEPWGWATYHYGRWNFDDAYGWYWVPQTQWAPAWVAWREGGGYCGWAPLPPRGRVAVSVNVEIAPRAFVFVDERHFDEPIRPATVIVNNTTIINRTTVINRTNIVNKTVINEGPKIEQIERVSGRKVPVVAAHQIRVQEETPVAVKLRASQGQPVKPQLAHPPARPTAPANAGNHPSNMQPKQAKSNDARVAQPAVQRPARPAVSNQNSPQLEKKKPNPDVQKKKKQPAKKKLTPEEKKHAEEQGEEPPPQPQQ
jgi:hypothetical protein